MAALRQLPLRSVLLTSGTLSPLESFAHELQLGFKYTLENPHVIQSNQVRHFVKLLLTLLEIGNMKG
jgi:regulator of telomere elongation helicase 1